MDGHRYHPLRVGRPAGTIWLSIDAAEDEWQLIEAFVEWERKDCLRLRPVDPGESALADGPLISEDAPLADDLPF